MSIWPTPTGVTVMEPAAGPVNVTDPVLSVAMPVLSDTRASVSADVIDVAVSMSTAKGWPT